MCRGLEARQALEAGEAAAAPAFARPRAPRQGPPPATPHSPSARRPARACPGLPRLSPPASGPPPLGLRAPGIPPPLLFASPAPFSPGPAACLSTLRLYLLRERGVEARAVSSSEHHGSATLSRRRHYALRRGAARGWRAAVSAGGRRSERAEREHTAALRPTGEEQPRRSPPREGGWAAAWGGVSRPPQWLPRSQVDLRPRPGAATSAAPHPHPRLSRMRRPAPRRRPGDPSPPVLAPRRLR